MFSKAAGRWTAEFVHNEKKIICIDKRHDDHVCLAKGKHDFVPNIPIQTTAPSKLELVQNILSRFTKSDI